jgi:hypothetical protein
MHFLGASLRLGRTFLVFVYLFLKVGGCGMASSNDSNKNIAGIVSIVTAVGAMVTAITPVVNDIIEDARNHPHEKQEDKIIIPILYDKNFPLELDQAIRLLSDVGLKPIPSKISMSNAHPRYKDCIENQVLISNPRQKTKVSPGTAVYVKYIPNEVIQESRRLFEETKQKKINEKERTKEKLTDTVDGAKSNIKTIFTRTSKNKTVDEEGGD